ncbi:hypothetical protein OG204_17160 [Streptomyces sp. NBC_01387]|uniref:hypothetical protein n=1 Tax=unclassified Streptomyces TaxID=2593676 RepID=UPI0020254DA1|nr:hypothetical protein [Streptomyces sp. A 4/2]WSV55361.1 hypothetical protein OG282_17575 [Streptomyces sp. NBC_01014]
MSDVSNNFGPVVNMNGGRGNTGMKNVTVGGAAQDVELRAAVDDLTRFLQELRPHLTPDQARTVDDALPEFTPDRGALRERGIVLASVAQIAATVGAVGQPVAEAVGRLLALLG